MHAICTYIKILALGTGPCKYEDGICCKKMTATYSTSGTAQLKGRVAVQCWAASSTFFMKKDLNWLKKNIRTGSQSRSFFDSDRQALKVTWPTPIMSPIWKFKNGTKSMRKNLNSAFSKLASNIPLFCNKFKINLHLKSISNLDWVIECLTLSIHLLCSVISNLCCCLWKM